MDIQQALKTVIEGNNLSEQEMEEVMRQVMTGNAADSQIGAFLAALRMKGETVEEITGAARVMRELATPVKVATQEHLVDTCGTGGDGANTFNISTASAFVAAAAGAHVAKHGNRSVSSSSGSADLLEAAGVRLDLAPEQVASCIENVGVGFMFAPAHHSAMKHAIGPRKEMAIRTIFNVLGPLTNPAGALNQVMGVFSRDLLVPLARVFKSLGSRHVLVVHSADGLDEASIGAETSVAELKDGEVKEYTVTPETFGLQKASLDKVGAGSVEESLAIVKDVLDGKEGPALDIVAMNAGAAIYASGITSSWEEGVSLAQDVISSGQARQKLLDLVNMTETMS